MRKEIMCTAALMALAGISGCKTVSIDSTPRGAFARSAGQSLGSTPAVVEVNIFKPQKVSVYKDGYASKTVNVTFDSPNSINVALDREFNVKSNPTGADVYVNGELVGKTPAEAVAMDDSGVTILEVRKKGWLPAKMTVKTDTPVDVTLNMEQDGSGRRILDLEPTTDGVMVTSNPIYSDTDIGEHSPNVSSCKKLTNQSQTEYILTFLGRKSRY